MFNKNEIDKVPEKEMIPTTPGNVQLSPIQIMQEAKAAGLSIEDMRQILELQRNYEANEARKEFHKALSEFKKNPPQIVKDMLNKQYSSSYVSIGKMVNTVNEAMGPFGLSARWDFPPMRDNSIFCTCILSHSLGHEVSVTLDGLVDASGSKNPLQGRKSTRTYLKLETYEAVTGMASIDGNIDDDGNSAGQAIEYIDENLVKTIHAKLTKNNIDMAQFKDWLRRDLKVDSIEQLPLKAYNIVNRRIDQNIQARQKAAK